MTTTPEPMWLRGAMRALKPDPPCPVCKRTVCPTCGRCECSGPKTGSTDEEP